MMSRQTTRSAQHLDHRITHYVFERPGRKPQDEFSQRYVLADVDGKARVVDLNNPRRSYDFTNFTELKTPENAAVKEWLKAPERAPHRTGITFDPSTPERLLPDGRINLWSGWSVEPSADASCEIFLRHVRENLCGGVVAHADYTFDWLAHMVQRTAEKPGVALVLCSEEKGTGKSVFAVTEGPAGQAQEPDY